MIQFDEHFFQMGWNHQLEPVWSRNLAGTSCSILVQTLVSDSSSISVLIDLPYHRLTFQHMGFNVFFWFDISRVFLMKIHGINLWNSLFLNGFLFLTVLLDLASSCSWRAHQWWCVKRRCRKILGLKCPNLERIKVRSSKREVGEGLWKAKMLAKHK